MKLQISIIKHRGNPPSHQDNHLFNQEGGNIGRSKENTWCLPDERNFLSRIQASVIFQNEKFYLIDKSSNGCFINNANTPIGKGSSQELSNNDIIRMGEYELQTNYIEESSNREDENSSYNIFSSQSSTSLPSDGISQTSISSDDPFGDIFRPKYENEDKYIKPTIDSSFDASTPIDLPPLVKNTTAVNPRENTSLNINSVKAVSPPPSPSELAKIKNLDEINEPFNTIKEDEIQNDPFQKPTPQDDKLTGSEQKGGFTQIFGGKKILNDDSLPSATHNKEPDNIFDTNYENIISSPKEKNAEVSSSEKKSNEQPAMQNNIFTESSSNDENPFPPKQEDKFPPSIEEQIIQDEINSSPFEKKVSDNIFDINDKNIPSSKEKNAEAGSAEKKSNEQPAVQNNIFTEPSFNDENSHLQKQEDTFSQDIEEPILQNSVNSSSFEKQESDDIFGIDNSNNDNKEKIAKENSSLHEEESNRNEISNSSPPPPPVKEETIQPSPKEKDDYLFEELFKAAGIDTQKFKIEASKETSMLIGQVLQAALQGTMDLLRSRAETKDVFRVGDKTIISIARNNPLKFLPTTDHVITQLILSDDNQQAYTPLVEAIEESFDDLKAHQFALSMSIQEALSSTIKDYFSPKNLQEKLEKSSSIGSKLPWQRKANLWKLFEEAYDGIEEEASEQFQLVLERKIADAYEFHMRQIKQQRS